MQPLHGIRVIEIAQGYAAPFAAKLLGDLGAEVIKVEPPGGDWSRAVGPFPGAPHPETSTAFLAFNTSKKSAVLDLDDAADRERLRALAAGADVVIAGEPDPWLAAHGIGQADLRARNPRLVVTTVSGFGSEGPYRDYRWNHLIACALGGWARLCGVDGREPVQSGARLAETMLGGYAAVATLIALEARDRHGQGDHVDVSGWEAMINSALLLVQRFEYTGDLGRPVGRINTGPSFILSTREGYIGANALSNAQWELMCAFFGYPELVDDPEFRNPVTRMRRSPELNEWFAARVADRTADEVFHDAQAWRIPFGTIPSLAGVLDLLPHHEREFFTSVDHPVAGRFRTPGIPFRFGEERPAQGRPPLLGEHGDEVLGDPAPAPSVGDAAPTSPLPPPLDGLRIIDLSMFMSGPMATLICADGGAEVIKVESLQRIDGWRGAAAGDGPIWEKSPAFNWVNRNKREITLNLTDERGAALLKRLVADADVLIENYTPRVMRNFGLDYETLRAIRPDLIVLSMPGFGLTGSWKDYTAFAYTTEQMAGWPHLTGYADGEPLFSGTAGGDPIAGLMGALALLAGLQRRRRTGAGCHIDLSQLESVTAFLCDAVTACSLTGDDPGRRGNANPLATPHNIYPCAAERWIAIACETDQEFAALARLMERPDWVAEGSVLRGLEGRRAAAAELDAAIATWTRDRDGGALWHQLQAAGIPAGFVMHGLDELEDPHLNARDFFYAAERAIVGMKRNPGPPYRFLRAAPPRRDRPSPTLGEHNHEILGGLLGLSSGEIATLEADDVTGTVPVAARAD